MEKLFGFVAVLVFLGILIHGGTVTALRSKDGSEEWGYQQVRPSKPNALEFCDFHDGVVYLEHLCCILKFKLSLYLLRIANYDMH